MTDEPEARWSVTATSRFDRDLARLSPVHTSKRPFFTTADLVAVLSHRQADPKLFDELNELAGETTENTTRCRVPRVPCTVDG